MTPRRIPLYVKMLLLFGLNVAMLGLAFGWLVRAEFGLGRDWPVSSGANGRIDALSGFIFGELSNKSRPQWSDILQSINQSYSNNVTFLLFAEEQAAGPPTLLPPEVDHRMHDMMRGPPPGRPGPGRRPERPGDEPPPGAPDSPPPGRDPHPKSVVHTSDPSRYWIVIPGQLPGPRRPIPVALVAVSDSLSAGGLFFDFKPWLLIGAGAILFSALLWLPLALGINRSVSQMTRATAQIAEGRFDVRVDERRRDELGALGHAINQMAVRLAGLVAGQKRFLGDVAHELVSPLAKLRVALGILDQRCGAGQQGYVDQAEQEAARMANLINEILSFSRTAIGAAKVELAPVPLADAVNEAIRREQKNDAKIESHVDAALQVVAERELLTRAIANLLRNAIDYAGEAGPITVSAQAAGEQVKIVVADCGPGAPEAELEKMLEPFYRLDASRDRATGGVGLGLAIVKTCVEACHGAVTCRNRQPTGLEVTLTLPTALSPQGSQDKN